MVVRSLVLDEGEPPALAATPAAVTPVGPEALNLWGVGAKRRGRKPFVDSPTDPVIVDRPGCLVGRRALSRR